MKKINVMMNDVRNTCPKSVCLDSLKKPNAIFKNIVIITRNIKYKANHIIILSIEGVIGHANIIFIHLLEKEM